MFPPVPLPRTPYVPGELAHYCLIRGDTLYNHHQNPTMFEMAPGELYMVWSAYDVDECNNAGVLLCSVSTDSGETWSPPEVFLAAINALVSHLYCVRVEGAHLALAHTQRHMSGFRADVVRRRLVSWARYEASPSMIVLKRSPDNGVTWDYGTVLDETLIRGLDAPGVFYAACEGLYRLGSGRLLLPINYLDQTAAEQCFVGCFLLSDDAGRTWSRSETVTVDTPRGVMEPQVVELEGGELFCIIRTKGGCQYQTRSRDGGQTWEPTRPSALTSPESMARIIRLQSGRLLVVRNPVSSTTQSPRYPLSASLSDDGGHTWGPDVVLADDSGQHQLSNFWLSQLGDGRIIVATSHYRTYGTEPNHSDLDTLVFDEAWVQRQAAQR